MRLTIVLAVLMGITLVSWATGHRSSDPRSASVAVLVLTFVKIVVVLSEFMEVRHAPRWLKGMTYGWAALACGLLILIDLFGARVAPAIRAAIL